MKFGFIIFFHEEVNQKGNPVQIRSCTRSCKSIKKVSESMPLLKRREGAEDRTSQKTCQFHLFLLSGKTAKILCKFFKLLILFKLNFSTMKVSSLMVIVLLLCLGGIFTSCQKSGYTIPTHVLDFESLTVPQAGYWNGSDASGSFSQDVMKFDNEYTAAWKTWAGFSYSQKNDVTTAGYTNEFSVADPSNKSNKFAVYYPSFGGDIFATFTNGGEFEIPSMDICNSTYAALSMKNGDGYSKKFGGASGTDPDWFKVTVNGYDISGAKVSSVDIYLADFRFTDSSKDYILTKWTTVDLSSLGIVHKISFVFSSSDSGAYGINTPSYLCIDNIKYRNTHIIL